MNARALAALTMKKAFIMMPSAQVNTQTLMAILFPLLYYYMLVHIIKVNKKRREMKHYSKLCRDLLFFLGKKGQLKCKWIQN